MHGVPSRIRARGCHCGSCGLRSRHGDGAAGGGWCAGLQSPPGRTADAHPLQGHAPFLPGDHGAEDELTVLTLLLPALEAGIWMMRSVHERGGVIGALLDEWETPALLREEGGRSYRNRSLCDLLQTVRDPERLAAAMSGLAAELFRIGQPTRSLPASGSVGIPPATTLRASAPSRTAHRAGQRPLQPRRLRPHPWLRCRLARPTQRRPQATPLSPARGPPEHDLAFDADHGFDLDQTPAYDPSEPDPHRLSTSIRAPAPEAQPRPPTAH
jgi:hypothetical protein